MENPFLIKYSEHPAFKDFAKPDDFDGMDLFKTIDNKFKAVIADKKAWDIDSIDKYLKLEITPVTKKLRELIQDHLEKEDVFHPVALDAVDKFDAVLREEARVRNLGKAMKLKKSKKDNISQMAKDFDQKGFVVKKIDEGKLSEYWKMIEPWRKQLESIRDSQRPQGMASCNISLPQEGPAWKHISSLIYETGIPEAVTEYSNYPLDLDYCALQLSHPYENWWKGCYEDVGLPTSETAYLHYDQDFMVIKALIYLQPVTKENSPFSIIPGSHDMIISESRNAFLMRLDVVSQVLYDDPALCFPYYRKQFKNETYRREFGKIPSVLRGTSAMGDDILNGSKQSEFILKNELKVTSEIGNCIAFTGGRTFHRGGMIEKGERWVLQYGFRQRDLSLKGWATRTRRKVKAATPQPLIDTYRSVKSRFI